MRLRCLFHQWLAYDDKYLTSEDYLWSVLFYRCARCGRHKAVLFSGAVEIEDLR